MPDLPCWCRLLLQGSHPQHYLHRIITTVKEKFKYKVKEKLVGNTCVQNFRSKKVLNSKKTAKY
jgi:hypothetical protein